MSTDPWAGAPILAGEPVLVYIVRKFTQGPEQTPEILSAWTNEYAAKHEATRWEQDSKIRHDYVRGWIGFESVET